MASFDRVARRALGADEQHRAPVGRTTWRMNWPRPNSGCVFSRLMMWILLRSPKMKGSIFGFQKRVWCPKWTPASSICRMVTRHDRSPKGGLWPPRIPDDDPAAPGTDGAPPAPFPDTRSQVLMRVWIALPKKAALYTMKFLPEQCFRADTPMLRNTQISLKSPEEQQKLRIAGALAASSSGHDRRTTSPPASPPTISTASATTSSSSSCRRSRPTSATAASRRPSAPRSITWSATGYRTSERLKAGDIVNIDVAVIKNGYHGDTSRMYFVGKPLGARATPDRDVQECHVARHRGGTPRRAPRGHRSCDPEPGRVGRASRWCASTAVTASAGFITRIPRSCTTGSPAPASNSSPGMVFTIEPMINAGKRLVRVLPDGWTVVTRDHSLSAQWEHMVLVTPPATRCSRSDTTRATDTVLQGLHGCNRLHGAR